MRLSKQVLFMSAMISEMTVPWLTIPEYYDTTPSVHRYAQSMCSINSYWIEIKEHLRKVIDSNLRHFQFSTFTEISSQGAQVAKGLGELAELLH